MRGKWVVFRVKGSGCRVWGVGVWRFEGLGPRVLDSELWV